jgi:hypothetical protein
MDKILTRKLFKNVYLQSVSKNILRFKEGGLASLKAKHYQLGGLSEGERTAMLLQPIATQLLTGTRQPGQSELGAVATAFGQALPQVTKTRLAIDEAETKRLEQLAKLKKEGKDRTIVKALSEEEIKARRFAPGTKAEQEFIYTSDGTIIPGKTNIIEKPGAEALKTRNELINTANTLNRIYAQYEDLGKPVGMVDLKQIKAKFGEAGGSDYSVRYQAFKNDIELTSAFLNKAISGAAISEKERSILKSLIPSVNDSESQFEAKYQTSKRFLTDLARTIETNPELTPEEAVGQIKTTYIKDKMSKPDNAVTRRSEGKKTLTMSDLKKIAGE